MLSKCANPQCSTTLHYLREGKVFKMEPVVIPKDGETARKPMKSVEHFWLCGPCSESWTLLYDRESGIRVAAKPAMVKHAAAS
jgi:hypothetical protein